MDITIRNDGTRVWADVSGAEPKSELYIEIRSKPVPPNPSTEGRTSALHKTVLADGTCHLWSPTDFLLEDLPREITVIGPITSEVFTA